MKANVIVPVAGRRAIRIISIHASVALGGSGKSWMLLLRCLRASFEVWSSAPKRYPSPEVDRSHELPIDCPQISRRFWGNLWYAASFPGFVVLYAWTFWRISADVVHLNSFYLLQPMLAAKLTRASLITHVREARPKYPPLLYSAWVLLASIASDRLIFCSRRDMLEFSRKDLIYLPNWICLGDVDHDLSDSEECDRPLAPSRLTAPTLLVVSQLISGKGHDFALEIFSALHKLIPEARLLIAGGTNNNPNNIAYAARLKARYSAAGLAENVTFLGEVRNVCSMMRLCKFVLMPSPAESFSRVHLEAMASGAVLIATDAGSTRDVIEDAVDGIIIRFGDAEEGARRIASAMSDPEDSSRMSLAARRKIETRYTDKIWGPVATDIFRSAASCAD